MKRTIKICLALAACISIVSCKSREEKALALIDKEMFASLYDYESYQPAETKIDSAFNVAEYNAKIIALGTILKIDMETISDEYDAMKRAQKSMIIWSDSYSYSSSFGRAEYNEAKDEMNQHLETARKYGKKTVEDMIQIREEAAKLDNKFCGWKVTHKFRCKTKGGQPDLGTYVYILDKDLETILYNEDANDEELFTIKQVIKDIINMTEEEFKQNISVYTDEN